MTSNFNFEWLKNSAIRTITENHGKKTISFQRKGVHQINSLYIYSVNDQTPQKRENYSIIGLKFHAKTS